MVTMLHYPMARFFDPLKPDLVLIRLKVQPNIPGQAAIWYYNQGWHRYPMYLFCAWRHSRYYQAHLRVATNRLRYFFEFIHQGKIYRLKDRSNQNQPFEISWDPDQIFQTPDWARDAICYQIFPERFCNGNPNNDPPGVQPWGGIPTRSNFFGGDLEGIIQKLDYLQDLGINCIWLNPIFASTSNHKYDTMDYLSIDPHFGNLEKFKELVDALHQRGMRIILDAVLNHTGDEFWAFRDVVEKGQNSAYADWYYIYDYPVSKYPRPNYECWWGFPDLPKLNVKNPKVRQYLLNMIAYWTKTFYIDGWRLDVPNEIESSFWQEFRQVVKSINPNAYIVGEIWGCGRPWLHGDQFDAVMNYLFRDAVLDLFARRHITVSTFDYRIKRMLLSYQEQANYCLLNLLGSHDTARILTVFEEEAPTAMAANASAIERLKLALIFQFTFPGIPMIYYGDEVGMKGGPDPGCRAPMVWDVNQQDLGLRSYYRHLIRIRRQVSALRRGQYLTLTADNRRWIYAYARLTPYSQAIVALNLEPYHQSIALPLWKASFPRSDTIVDLLQGEAIKAPSECVTIPLPPLGGAILAPFSQIQTPTQSI
ncbi:MAG: glycoside hydrolase family 13 protein [Clostridia bacterium]|nr:glycoside hydrolase family 13 protein [Clostridia bacterium]